ncbi:MAG: TldD/PmbA family protein, partial [Cytophagaceae bacterium]
MNRRDFNQMLGLSAAGILLPNVSSFGRSVDPSVLLESGLDVAVKKRLADAALNAAKAKGATYTDVRIGRYLRQFVITREDKVQNIVNTESYGVGVRVIANGCWGFSALVDAKNEADVARAAEE